MNFEQGVKEMNRVRHRAILGYGLIIFGFISGGVLMVMFSPVILLLGFAIMILGAFFAKGTVKEYKNLYKDLFIKRPLTENFDNVHYDWTSGFSEKTVENFQICRMGNRFYSEDLVQASYQGIPFEMSDVIVKTNSPGQKVDKIHFQGRILVFDLPNKNLNSVQVYSKMFRNKTDLTTAVNIQNIEMENVEFNKKFLIRAISPQDAFYLLTPQLMERIMAYSQRFQNIAIHACGNKMVLALNDLSKDSFDADITFKKVSYQEEAAKINKEINDIKAIISIINNMNPGTSETDEAKTLKPGGFLIEHTANINKYVDNAL